MDNGVTIMDPDSTFIDDAVVVAADSVIYPFTWLEGRTSIGTGCVIGPNSRIADTVIGDGDYSILRYVHECQLGTMLLSGRMCIFGHGTILADGVKIGNFVEVKNTACGAGQ